MRLGISWQFCTARLGADTLYLGWPVTVARTGDAGSLRGVARTFTSSHGSAISQARTARCDRKSCTTLLRKQWCAAGSLMRPGTTGAGIAVPRCPWQGCLARLSAKSFASAAASACGRGLLVSELLRAHNWYKVANTALTV